MARTLFNYTGRFQWWLYDVSHGQLLLRSTKCLVRQTQIDILFKDVTFVNLATSIDDLVVLETDALDQPGEVKLATGQKIFLINGKGFSGFIMAGAVFQNEGPASHGDISPLMQKFPPD